MADLEFTKATDEEHVIKLDPKIIRANWLSSVAMAGGEAMVEVATVFVGAGAPIKIVAKASSGKKIGELSSKIQSPRFVGKMAIAADAPIGETALFEVELQKNSVKDTSDSVAIVPKPDVSELKWSVKEARRGDVLTLTAKTKNIESGREVLVKILEYDADGVHDPITELTATVSQSAIELMWEYEYHEDTDEIPTDEELQNYGSSYNPPEYFFVVDVDGMQFGNEQESGLLLFKDYVEIELVDAQGLPLADCKFKLVQADGTEREGTTDEDGVCRIEDVPPGPCNLVLEEEDDSDEG